MNAQAEEDDRIAAEIAQSDWCAECQTCIGVGNCQGCIAVASLDLAEEDFFE